MRIVAIGGGDVGAGETLSIDRKLISLAQRSRPTILFVPTASADSEEYIERFSRSYLAEGCEVEVLRLYSADDAETARDKLESCDAVYVGGGNTLRMIALWKSIGFDLALKSFSDSGRPVGGLSAGAICWFRVANSDWPIHEGVPGVNTAPLEGLGWVDLAICPHTRDEGFRLAEFATMMRGVGGVGIGLDDGAAIEVYDDRYRFLAAQPNSYAHRVYWAGDQVRHEVLSSHDDFRPLSVLKNMTTTIGVLL